MKTMKLIYLLVLLSSGAFAQKIKPCDDWQTDFIQVEPKTDNGLAIDKYVEQQLLKDTSLRTMATCMVGIKVYANCNGEFSYEPQTYRNNASLSKQCNALLKKTEHAMNEIKLLTAGTIGGKKKDFIFKVVVKVTRGGQPKTEILY